MVATRKTADTSPTELAELMVGRKVLLRVEKTKAQPGDEVLRVDGLRAGRPAQGVERFAQDRVFPPARGGILGMPAWPGMASRNCWKCGRSAPGRKAGMVAAANRCRCPGQKLQQGRRGRRAAGIAHVPVRIAHRPRAGAAVSRDGKTPHLVTNTHPGYNQQPVGGFVMAQRITCRHRPPRWNGF